MAAELWRVVLPYACYGVIIRDGAVVEAAPIANWAAEQRISLVRFKAWVLRKDGTIELVGPDPRPAVADQEGL